jgi:hypothetical protein
MLKGRWRRIVERHRRNIAELEQIEMELAKEEALFRCYHHFPKNHIKRGFYCGKPLTVRMAWHRPEISPAQVFLARSRSQRHLPGRNPARVPLSGSKKGFRLERRNPLFMR